MKKIFLFIVLVSLISCKAQTYPLRTYGISIPMNAYLKDTNNELPAYELPAKWLFIKSIPLNTNGKVDRKAIKQHFEL